MLQNLQQLAVPSPREPVRPAYRLPVAFLEVCSSWWLSCALRRTSVYANAVAQTSADVVKLCTREHDENRSPMVSPPERKPAFDGHGLRTRAAVHQPAPVLSAQIAETESTDAEVRARQQEARALCDGDTNRAHVIDEPQKRVNVSRKAEGPAGDHARPL